MLRHVSFSGSSLRTDIRIAVHAGTSFEQRGTAGTECFKRTVQHHIFQLADCLPGKFTDGLDKNSQGRRKMLRVGWIVKRDE